MTSYSVPVSLNTEKMHIAYERYTEMYWTVRGNCGRVNDLFPAYNVIWRLESCGAFKYGFEIAESSAMAGNANYMPTQGVGSSFRLKFLSSEASSISGTVQRLQIIG